MLIQAAPWMGRQSPLERKPWKGPTQDLSRFLPVEWLSNPEDPQFLEVSSICKFTKKSLRNEDYSLVPGLHWVSIIHCRAIGSSQVFDKQWYVLGEVQLAGGAGSVIGRGHPDYKLDRDLSSVRDVLVCSDGQLNIDLEQMLVSQTLG